MRGPDPVQLRAQEIDEAANIRIVVQRDPLSVPKLSGSGVDDVGPAIS
jgi:hypothetical protein